MRGPRAASVAVGQPTAGLIALIGVVVTAFLALHVVDHHAVAEHRSEHRAVVHDVGEIVAASDVMASTADDGSAHGAVVACTGLLLAGAVVLVLRRRRPWKDTPRVSMQRTGLVLATADRRSVTSPPSLIALGICRT